MTRTNATAFGLIEFEALVDVFGADPARWPEPRRTAAEALLATDVAAKALLDEASALDALLAKAPRPSPDRFAGLTDSIVAAAVASQPLTGQQAADTSAPLTPDRFAARHSATIVPLKPRPATAGAAPTPRHMPAGAALPRRASQWRTATALAASLVLGVMLGSYDIGPVQVHGLFQISATDHEVEQFVAALRADAMTPHVDEEQL